MIYKQINLLLLGMLVIILTLQIHVYNDWLQKKVIGGAAFQYQLDHMALDQRMGYRFGVPYSVYKGVEKTIRAACSTATVLLPPDGYIKAMKPVNDFKTVPPAIFYYFTGLKAVNVNSVDLPKADWVMVIENHRVGIRRIADSSYLNQMVTEFRKYK